MTQITSVEIKILVIQIVFMAILGGFMTVYAVLPTPINSPDTTAIASTNTTSPGNDYWILGLVYVPDGMETMILVSSLVLAPFLLFDAFIAARFLKDLATQWV